MFQISQAVSAISPTRINIYQRIIKGIAITIQPLWKKKCYISSLIFVFRISSSHFPKHFIYTRKSSDSIIIISRFKILQVRFSILFFSGEKILVYIISRIASCANLSIRNIIHYLEDCSRFTQINVRSS